MTKIHNRDFIQGIVKADTRPGTPVHKVTTIGSIPKHTKEMMLKNKVFNRAMHNLHGYTYRYQATVGSKEAMDAGHLHHAKIKHVTATGFIKDMFTKKEEETKLRHEQNIKDTKADRAKDEAKTNRAIGASSALPSRDAIHSVSTTGPGMSKTHMLLHEDETSVRKDTHTDALSLLRYDNGAIETNLKPASQLPQLPQAIAKPDSWEKADAEIEEPAID